MSTKTMTISTGGHRHTFETLPGSVTPGISISTAVTVTLVRSLLTEYVAPTARARGAYEQALIGKGFHHNVLFWLVQVH